MLPAGAVHRIHFDTQQLLYLKLWYLIYTDVGERVSGLAVGLCVAALTHSLSYLRTLIQWRDMPLYRQTSAFHGNDIIFIGSWWTNDKTFQTQLGRTWIFHQHRSQAFDLCNELNDRAFVTSPNYASGLYRRVHYWYYRAVNLSHIRNWVRIGHGKVRQARIYISLFVRI